MGRSSGEFHDTSCVVLQFFHKPTFILSFSMFVYSVWQPFWKRTRNVRSRRSCRMSGTHFTLPLFNDRGPDHRTFLTCSYSIYNRYVDLHDQARGYKKEVKKINTKRLKVGKTPLVGQNVEMHNFQDPQVRVPPVNDGAFSKL